MLPIISVIIPSYNEEKLIGKCLESLKMQTLEPEKFEVIVVDNNSTDRTVEIAKQYSATVLHYKDLSSIGVARQHGAAKAHGKILAFIDSDSFAAKNWLEVIDEYIQGQNLAAVCGVGLPDKDTFFLRYLFSFYDINLRFQQILGIVLPWGFNLSVRKDAFDEIGGFNTSLKTGEDWDIGLRIQKKFGKRGIVYSPRLKVYTSTRKQENTLVLVKYVWYGVINYINLIILKKAKTKNLVTIR